MRIGIVQTRWKYGDREANFAKAEAWLDKNLEKSDEETVVLLPEMFDVGYAVNEAEKLADDGAKQAISFLSEAAKKHGTAIIGSVLAKENGVFFNRALIVDKNGNLAGKYDKTHLVPMYGEDKLLTAGNELCVCGLAGTTVGTVICYDLRFCEWTRACAVNGAKVLFIPAVWPHSRIEHWRTLLRARAIENLMYVAACNIAHDPNGTHSGGHSAVIDPWGNTIYEAGESESGSEAVISINPDSADENRAFLRVFDMRRPELYKKYL